MMRYGTARPFVTAISGAVIVIAAACGVAAATEASYTCSDGTRVKAVFSPPSQQPGQVVLIIAGVSGEITVPQAMSADGARYAADGVEFWIKGRSATFTRNGASATCETK